MSEIKSFIVHSMSLVEAETDEALELPWLENQIYA